MLECAPGKGLVMDRAAIGQALRDRRQELARGDARRSIAWYARKLGCSTQTLMNIETGTARTPIERVEAYAELLGLDVQVGLLDSSGRDLLGASNQPEPSAYARVCQLARGLAGDDLEMVADLLQVRVDKASRQTG